jgi:hypothetical protein
MSFDKALGQLYPLLSISLIFMVSIITFLYNQQKTEYQHRAARKCATVGCFYPDFGDLRRWIIFIFYLAWGKLNYLLLSAHL